MNKVNAEQQISYSNYWLFLSHYGKYVTTIIPTCKKPNLTCPFNNYQFNFLHSSVRLISEKGKVCNIFFMLHFLILQ